MIINSSYDFSKIGPQDGNFGPDAPMNTQAVKADECVRDMVGATQVENQPRGCVEDC